MRDKHSDLFRVGKVSSIDYEKCTAQVVFEDRHDLVSGDLHIIVPKTLKDHAYYMPDIDERVVCYFDPSAPTKGYIVGSYYADTRIPPRRDEHKFYLKLKDDTLIEYDRESHTLNIHIPKKWEKKEKAAEDPVPEVDDQEEVSIVIVTESDINITTQGKVNLIAHDEINVTCHDKITVKADDVIDVHSDNDIKINSDTHIIMTAPRIDLNPPGAARLFLWLDNNTKHYIGN